MKKSVSILILFIVCPIVLFTQQQPPRFDKPGTFTILNRTNYTLPECGFTKAEMTANLQKIADVVKAVRKNPVLSDIVGFEGRARIYNTLLCTESGGYGVPSRISFEFCTWYLTSDGREELGTIEPPEWSLIINRLKPNTGYQFSESSFSGGYFSVPLKKETIERGIDVYGDECYVLYNPDRPPYWLPVTVKEAYDALRKTWEDHTDKVASASMLQFIEKEYAKIPESEINNPAYESGIFPTSVINPENESPPLLRINPEYWDRSLPKSAIQFIYFRSVPNKEYYRKLKEERKQKDSDYYLDYFLELFDMQNIRELLPLIGK
jgi:hypothetical protein